MGKYKINYKSIYLYDKTIEEVIEALNKVKKDILDKQPDAKDLLLDISHEYGEVTTHIEYKVPFSKKDYEAEEAKESLRQANRKKEYERLKKEFDSE